ncbi:carbohydrate ABC transporter permease [Tumebacillus sp. ITR2]|uniref:Carbohydrate ABC transporter permease n=1 Tax=Tumebacillus amylolyticus TaxID=2801339 RepID=A0ABS1J4F7_9BACL|nr:carbohydrate ABC transporter permease [Tumebacillus amylolyticus]
MRLRRIFFTISWWVAAILFVAFLAFPVLWMLSTSLKPSGEIFHIPPTWIPEHPTLHSFTTLWQKGNFLRYLGNSILVALATTGIAVVVASMAGYAFARLPFVGRKSVLFGILAAQMIPGVLFLLPIFMLMKQLGLLNSYLGLILANVTFALPFAIWMMYGFYKHIPAEIEEAAWVDGAGFGGTYFRVVLPMGRPGLLSCAIFCFLSSWDEFVFALALNTRDELRTMPVGLYNFVGQYGIEWNYLMAGALLVTIPAMIFFALFQKQILSGFAAGAVKG